MRHTKSLRSGVHHPQRCLGQKVTSLSNIPFAANAKGIIGLHMAVVPRANVSITLHRRIVSAGSTEDIIVANVRTFT